MSLDFNLKLDKKVKREITSGIFIRENGQTKEITEKEWFEKFPNREPVRVLVPEIETEYVYQGNITHNLGKMATVAGIYNALWHPKENGFKTAEDVIQILERGVKMLKVSPANFKKFDAPNGWGTYEQFLPFVEEVLQACKKYPNAKIETSR